MTKGGWLFVIIAGGYLIFEVSMLQRLGYRMEVEHILEKMVSAEQAMVHCGDATPSQKKQYAKRLALLETRATREMAESNPALDAGQAAALFAGQVEAMQQLADASVLEQGCNSPAVATLLKRYAIYAGRR